MTGEGSFEFVQDFHKVKKPKLTDQWPYPGVNVVCALKWERKKKTNVAR